MSSDCRSFPGFVVCLAAAVAIVSAACGGPSQSAHAMVALRVCADPNNLPFSNDRLDGFENQLARLIAADLGTTVRYTWWAQRRGFLRNTLNAGLCDVVMGLPTDVQLAQTTRPYYRSSYVFVTQRTRALRLRSFDDPTLRRLRIGVPLIGDDGAGAPPAHALSRRGIIRGVVGYSVYGNYTTESPPSALIDAVGRGDVDVAIAWGPLAAFFASRSSVPLDIVPVAPQIDLSVPMAFDISVAVRRGDVGLARRLEEVLDRRHADVDAILAAYRVPRVDRPREPTP